MIHPLSTLSLNNGSVPLGSCVNDLNRKRRMKLGFVFSISHNRAGGYVFSTPPKFDFRCGFLLGYSEIKYVTVLKPNKSRIGELASPLGWSLGDVAIGSELVEEQNDSELGNGELEDINTSDSDQVRESYSEQKMNGDSDAEEGEKEEYSGRIDVRELAKSLQRCKTVEDVEEVLKDKGELPSQVYSTILIGFGREKRMKSAMILFEWMKKRKVETNGSFAPNRFIYNCLLNVAKQCEKFVEIEAILNEMNKDGISYNVVTYNTLMSIYIKKGECEKALNMIEVIHKNGLTPSPASYSQALRAYRKMKDGNGALNFFLEFREKYRGGEIGTDNDGEDWEMEFKNLERFTIRVCYQIMRGWLVSSENLSSNVLGFLITMDNAGIPLTYAELELLMWACTREDHYIVVKELYIWIRERFDKISLPVCNHAIWLMGKNKKWWAALEVYEDLLDKGPKPNKLSYELVMSHFKFLLNAAKKKGIWKWAVNLLNKMEEKGLKPGTDDWNAVLVACSKASETTAAVQIFKRMVENGEKPNIISYGALLTALKKGKLYDDALHVWNHMLKVGIKPNVFIYTTMASIYTAQGNFSRVDAIIKEMVTSNIEVTVVTYNAIISGSARNGMSSAAYEWFHKMKVQNITPDEITYEGLIRALANDGKPRLAYELYLRAQNEGLILSSKAYDAVVESSQAHGATIDIGFLGPRPADKKIKAQSKREIYQS